MDIGERVQTRYPTVVLITYAQAHIRRDNNDTTEIKNKPSSHSSYEKLKINSTYSTDCPFVALMMSA